MGSVRTAPVGRSALVTGGSQVVFKELIDEVITPNFLGILYDNGFTSLSLQCGTYLEEVEEKLATIADSKIKISAFASVPNLREVIEQACRGLAGGQRAGVVISHAGKHKPRFWYPPRGSAMKHKMNANSVPLGTGTIADCNEVRVAQIIVANPHLMDDHQTPFAFEIVKEFDHLVHGHLG